MNILVWRTMKSNFTF